MIITNKAIKQKFSKAFKKFFEGKGHLVHLQPHLKKAKRKNSAKIAKIATNMLRYLKYAAIGKHSLL